MENRRNILMDCDPGIDDAAALCVAAAHPEAFRILGISTVAGNQTIETVTENALRLTQFFGLDVPVAQGAKVPLTRPAKTAADIHGKNGLGDVEIPKTDRKAVSDNAVVFLRDQIMGLPKGERVTPGPHRTFDEHCPAFEGVSRSAGARRRDCADGRRSLQGQRDAGQRV